MTDFEDRLEKRGLLPSTRQKYAEIVRSSGSEDPIAWIRRKVGARTPLGTVLPLRAAVKHYLIAEQGYSEDELRELLPRARGKDANTREPLSQQGLAVYHVAVEQLDTEPARTILTLLPSTGLRITEMCRLRRQNLRHGDDAIELMMGPGRSIPLSHARSRVLAGYLRAYGPEEWLFPGRMGQPITPHAVRIHTRALREMYPELGSSFSPQTLRATYAAMMLRKGVGLQQLQQLMGHESVVTTQRYAVRHLSD